MSNIPDPVTMAHPLLPGEVHTVSRRAFVSHSRRGWVDVTESTADVAGESTDVDAPTTSQED